MSKYLNPRFRLFMVAPFDYQRENTRSLHLIHMFMLKEYGYDIHGNLLQMECKQMQVN